jgi:hypothetical protein
LHDRALSPNGSVNRHQPVRIDRRRGQHLRAGQRQIDELAGMAIDLNSDVGFERNALGSSRRAAELLGRFRCRDHFNRSHRFQLIDGGFTGRGPSPGLQLPSRGFAPARRNGPSVGERGERAPQSKPVQLEVDFSKP